jgi:uncharacterized protein
MKNQTEPKWYAGGLAFACRGCGNCCAGPEEGYVWADKQEIEAMARHLGITTEQFVRQYTRRIGVRYSLIEKQPGKDCIFLSKTPAGKGCDVYPVRPRQCRTWPFWNENLRSHENWQQAAQHCPGINQDQWYDLETIEAIRDGNELTHSPSRTPFEAAAQWIYTHTKNTPCLRAMQELYASLDQTLAAANPSCANCGDCCDFQHYGHRLYVTTLEMLYFLHGLQKTQSPPKISRNGRCPWQNKSGCTQRSARPATCRIFYCRGLSTDFQSELTENILLELRSLHQQFSTPYYYADLLDWLPHLPQIP